MVAYFEPNAGVGQVTLLNKLQCLAILPLLPWTLVRVFLRRVFVATHGLSLKVDLILALIRAASPFIPLSITRSAALGQGSKFAQSRRFASVKAELYQQVPSQEFAGYWVCQGAPGQSRAPNKCDLVIYHIHGGAYHTGHPAQGLAFFLRIAEIASKSGISIAVFALDYSLTPEAKYPTQLTQAKAAYRYLVEAQKIDPKKIALYGDSAGAHLVLTLLSALFEKQLPKPNGGVFLLAPWIDLRCSKDGSYVRNRDKDFLVRGPLIEAGYQVMPRTHDATLAHLINFSISRPNNQSWRDILPSKVWVGIGSHDLFLDDAVAFVNSLKKDGVSVNFDIGEGKVHGWHMVEDAFDTDKYFATVGDDLPEGFMNGAAMMARTIVSAVKS